jgi:hypothetical protein
MHCKDVYRYRGWNSGTRDMWTWDWKRSGKVSFPVALTLFFNTFLGNFRVPGSFLGYSWFI